MLTCLHYNDHENYLIVNKTGIWKFKTNDNISSHYFCLGSASKDYITDEISLNGTVYDFSVDHN